MNDKGYRLMKALGAIDDDMIEEAAPNAAARKRERNYRILAVAAGLVIVLLLTLILKPVLAPETEPSGPSGHAVADAGKTSGQTSSPDKPDSETENGTKESVVKVATDIRINEQKSVDSVTADMDITIADVALADSGTIDPDAVDDFEARTGITFADFRNRFQDYTLEDAVALNAPTGDGNYVFRDYEFRLVRGGSRVNVSFSPFGKPMRDYFFISDDMAVSVIDNTEVLIMRYDDNHYWAEFTADGLYYDIEADDIQESDFIEVLINIIAG